MHASVSIYRLQVAIHCSDSTGNVVGGPWPVGYDRKTQVMILQPLGVTASPAPVLLPTVHSVRYLSVTIDDGLTWNGHVDKVTKEVRKATGALWRSRRQLSAQSKLNPIEAYVWLECLCSVNDCRDP